jgi:hypothetical protein
MNHKVEIPPFYLELTKGYTKRATMFKGYVQWYIARNYPKLKLIRIEGMIAVCERKGNKDEEREKTKS